MRIKWQPDGDRLRTMARTKRGNELARGWRENSKLQQLAHSSTPLQFRARREFQCGLHAKPYSSSCKLPVRANHICFLPVHLSLSLYSPFICNNFAPAIRFFSPLLILSFCFHLFFPPFFFLFLFLMNIVTYEIETKQIYRGFLSASRCLISSRQSIHDPSLPPRRNCCSQCNLIYFLVGRKPRCSRES